MSLTDLLLRSIRPPDPENPNDNDAAEAFPNTVGPPDINPGDPQGFMVAETEPRYSPPPPTIVPSSWSGFPEEWVPTWNRANELADTAWACIDLNARALASMPPYLVNAAPTIDAGWLTNPSPGIYSSWDEFAKQLFWDWQAAGEAFVVATAFYSTGWPARFHVAPPWTVNVEMDGGVRTYSIGRVGLAKNQILHLRYKSSVDDAHGHGPLEAGRASIVNAQVLSRYAQSITSTVPPSLLEAPEEMSPDQAETLRNDWVTQRVANPGIPAVLTGGLKWTPTQLSPNDMALLELSQFTDGKIAVLLGVPPFLVGLPTGDSMTYSNVTSLFDYHWRSGLRPTASAVMAGLSEWLLPRGTTIEVNKDAYVQPDPLTRAQTAQILVGMGAMSVEEVREAERLDGSTEGVVAGPVIVE